VRVDAEQLLTPRDAQALLGVVVERMEPSGADQRRASFVCFGARGTRAPIVAEMVSLASATSGRRGDVPFVSVAVDTDRSQPLPRRTVCAKWEEHGWRFALTYTCVAATDSDELVDCTAGKRGAIAALARVVSERLAALPSVR
jgi:hypothetical protein